MGRPRTPVGQAGRITVTGKAGAYTARARFRDSDGRSRLVEASGTTKGKAETRLKAKLKDRQASVSSGEWRPDMTVGAAVEKWLADVMPDRRLSETSRALYVGNARRYITGSQLEHLTLAEANRVATLEGWLRRIVNGHGKGAAKGARSVLSHVLATAVRYDALPSSAMRDTKTPTAATPKTANRDADRAFTPAERDHLLAVADTHPAAIKYDVVDLLHFLAGTGVRITEALAVRWDDVDLATGELHVRGTKTEFADRHLHMPGWLTERLSARLEGLRAQDRDSGVVGLAGRGVVFHSPGTADRDKPRNRDNAIKKIRTVMDAAGMPWATSHTFRHTVITRIVEAGHDIGMAADQAGHSDLRTTTAYIGRKRSTAALRDVL